jgi:mRNA-degrading endonuclease RelE of RelBE toxin-antitoxin system
MNYTLRFAKPFLKSLKSLDQVTIRRIHQRLAELAQDPINPSSVRQQNCMEKITLSRS